MKAKNCYEILGVAPDASVEEIRAAYRREMAALRESAAHQAFAEELSRGSKNDKIVAIWASGMPSEKNTRRREDVLNAYTVLCDEKRRAKHDAVLAQAADTDAFEYGAGPPVRQPFCERVDSSEIASEARLPLLSLFKLSALLWGSCISLLFSLVLTITVVTGAVAGEGQSALTLFLSNARPSPLFLLAVSFLFSLALWYAMLLVVAFGLRLACDAEKSFDAGSPIVVLYGVFFLAWIAGICGLFFARHSAHVSAALDADPDLLWPLFVMPLLIGSISYYKLCTTRVSAYLYGLFLFLIVPLGHLAFVLCLASIFSGGANTTDYVFGGLHRLGGVAWSVLFFGACQWYIGKKLELQGAFTARD